MEPGGVRPLARLMPEVARWRVGLAALVSAVLVFALASSPDEKLATLALSACVAAILIPLLAKRPTFTLCALLATILLQIPVVGWLYIHGVPSGAARGLGALKDLLTVALVLRAVQDRSSHRRRLSDPWIIGYLAIVSAYLVLPIALSTLAQVPFSQRLLEWRIDCLFVIVFLSIRRIDPAALNIRVIRSSVIGLAALVAVIAVYEFYEPEAWRTFFYTTMGVQRYSLEVLGSAIAPDSFIRYGLNGNVRSKSLISDPVFCGFYLLPGMFLGITRISSGRWVGPTLLTTIIGAGLLATSTRAAVLVAVLGAVLASALMLSSGRRFARYLAPVVTVIVLLSPLIAARTPVLVRFTSAVAGQDESATQHADHFRTGLTRAFTEPLGSGLGTGPSGGMRFGVEKAIVSENAYLQVINGVGLLALIAFIGFLVVLLRELRQAGRGSDDRFLDRSAALALLLAMVVGGLFQQVWYDFSVSVVAAVVLALPQMTRSRDAPKAPAHPLAVSTVRA